MNSKDYFKDIYTDFFQTEIAQKEDTSNTKDTSKQIDDLYITEDSKKLLKKILEYMEKYNKNQEENYIPFRIIIQANYDVSKTIIDILYKACLEFNYIEDNKVDISLYNIEKEEINKYNFVVLKDLKGINLVTTENQEKIYFNIDNYLKTKEKSLVIVTGLKEELDSFFIGRENIKNKYFAFKIEEESPDIQDIYQNVLNKTKLKDKIKLLDYIKETYNKENYIEYEKNLIEYISFNKELPKIEKKKTLEETFKDLNELVGLKKVKKVLYELVDVIKLKEKDKDLKISNLNLHMVFLGNPGTGKTTIARIVANILYDLGYIKENKLIEVSSKDLVGQYVGQTAPKTMQVIEKSLNGVLFIDEAYSLAVKSDNSYNAEAIATLIQAMENYRDKLVVIFAGYTKEMRDFLDSNSGIVSRIGYTLEFDDYTTKELKQIYKQMIEKAGFKIEEAALKYLEEIIKQNRNVKNFGNARFIRNIYEKTIVKHASRVKNIKQKEIIKTITKEDISIENLELR